MTVKELIERLSTLDQDEKVYCIEPLQGDWGIVEVTDIEKHDISTLSIFPGVNGYLIV